MTNRIFTSFIAMTFAIALATSPRPLHGEEITVTVENVGAPGSLFLTPFWMGIHDGTFDTYDAGASAAGFAGLEQIAEDGDTAPLSTRFSAEQGGTGVDATLPATTVGPPPFDPGEAASMTFSITDPTVNRYLSYASMVVPSNDAFVANGNPLAHPIFDASGNFVGPFTIEIFGRDVNDAGTEVNNESNVAFLDDPNGQTGPNQGDDQNGVVATHIGFNGSVGNPAAAPVNILGGTTVSGATIDVTLGDFTRNGGDVLLARITVIPEPSSIVLLALAVCVGAFVVARRRLFADQ